MSAVLVREAGEHDLLRIVEIDRDRYGGDRTDDPVAVFRARLQASKGWFWVAEVAGEVQGLLSLAPTRTSPDLFRSWQESTANGTLNGVVDPAGEYVYGVALTVAHACPVPHVADHLMAVGGHKVIAESKRGVYFSGRMPGYHTVQQTMAPEDYYIARDEGGKPLDSQIRLYTQLGMQPLRLVPGAFLGDWESAEHGIVFWAQNPCFGWPLPKLWGRAFQAAATRPRLFHLAMRIGG